jgi:PKD repeat protein
MKTKQLTLLVALLLTFGVSYAQNKVDQYEYWFDGNYAGKVTTGVAPVSNFQLNTAVPTTGLSNGLHTFHVRFRDENNAFSSVLSSFFLKSGASGSGNALMSAYEYWFDNDYASKITGSLANTQMVNFSQNASTAALTQGLHTVHLRFQDNNGLWSSVVSQFFLKQGTTAPSGTPEMVEYEYWFDSNYAAAVTTPLSGNAVEQIATDLDVLALSDGLHTIHLRFKDATSKWSSAVSQFFLKQGSTSSINPEMEEYEYWFDTDYANKVTVAMAGNQVENVVAAINASSISNGLHTFHVRFKDANDEWSSALSQFFIKKAPSNVTNNLITTYRYWFDENDADMQTVNVSAPIQIYTLTTPVSMTQVPKGTHTIHFQFKDTLDMWSSVTTDTIYKNSLPIADFSADVTSLCDNGTVNFDNLSIDGDEFLWDFGDGNTSTDSLATHVYANPGIYTVSLTAIDPLVPIDSTTTITQMIHVYETPDPTITINGNDSICAGTSVVLSTAPVGIYEWSDMSTASTLSVNQAGTYSVTVYNIDNPACVATSDAVEIVLMPLPDASFTFSNVDHLVTFTNTSPEADAYSWNFGDGNTSSLENPVHDYQVNGVYDSYLVAYNFCGTDTAYVTIDLSFIGLTDQTISHELKLYPNPTRSDVIIEGLNTDSEGTIITITNSQGAVVLRKTFNQVENGITLDMSGLMNGAYYVRIENNAGFVGLEKVIVNR